MENRLTVVKQLIQRNLNVDLSLSLTSGSVYSKKILQHILCLKTTDSSFNEMLQLVCGYATAAEKECAFAGVEFFKQLITSSTDSEKVFSVEDLLSYLLSKKFNRKNVELMKEVARLSSAETKIFVKKSENHKTFIEVTEGHSFNINPLTLKKSHLTVDRPFVLCIDGYIESVSEIHHLLEEYSASKYPLILFTRGYANDVVTTLATNNSRGTLEVYPVVVAYDIENVNTLVDIALIAGTDVVSTTKGEVIGKDISKYCRRINKASLKNDGVVLNSDVDVYFQIKRLLETLETRHELEKVYSDRIRSLSSRQITIFIPNDMNYFVNSQELDMSIRMLIDTSLGKNPSVTAKKYIDSFEEYVKNVAQPDLLAS